MDMLDIRDSVAVVSGGASGIGLAVAKYWVENGGKAVIADVAEAMLKQAEAELKDLGGEVASVVCNVTDEDDCARLADTAIERFGKINLVAPFAGIIKDGLMLSPDKETGKVDQENAVEGFSNGCRY
jgi:3-oxoacyl-[acyl-carrier protein] reductase